MVAALAVAAIGFLMLIDWINWYYRATVLMRGLGLFAAASIFAGRQQARCKSLGPIDRYRREVCSELKVIITLLRIVGS